MFAVRIQGRHTRWHPKCYVCVQWDFTGKDVVNHLTNWPSMCHMSWWQNLSSIWIGQEVNSTCMELLCFLQCSKTYWIAEESDSCMRQKYICTKISKESKLCCENYGTVWPREDCKQIIKNINYCIFGGGRFSFARARKTHRFYFISDTPQLALRFAFINVGEKHKCTCNSQLTFHLCWHIALANSVWILCMKEKASAMSEGTWCSGITSASHAEGPGFKSQCVHLSGRQSSLIFL